MATISLLPAARWSFARFWLGLISTHDKIFVEENQKRLKHWVIQASIVGFAAHLLLIVLATSLPHPPAIIAAAGSNYLEAISTPFNFILFYEVLTLIAALPASTTSSIANQFEVVSLIYTRNVFTDFAKASEAMKYHYFSPQAMPLLMDMWAGLLMFLLVAVFQYVALQRPKPLGTPERSRRLNRFITQKKVVAMGLSAMLLCMAAYNSGLFVRSMYRSISTGRSVDVPAPHFYNDLFTVMIFTDVLVLILSLVVSGQYEMVFRNAAFVVSIILIRFSLAEEHRYAVVLALLAMMFGIVTLLVFNFHMKIKAMSPKVE